MNPAKEKAAELIGKYEMASLSGKMPLVLAKIYAEYAVNELINSYAQYNGMHDQEFFTAELNFWKEVKEEIRKHN